jgi:hypothetical protein
MDGCVDVGEGGENEMESVRQWARLQISSREKEAPPQVVHIHNERYLKVL